MNHRARFMAMSICLAVLALGAPAAKATVLDFEGLFFQGFPLNDSRTPLTSTPLAA